MQGARTGSVCLTLPCCQTSSWLVFDKADLSDLETSVKVLFVGLPEKLKNEALWDGHDGTVSQIRAKMGSQRLCGNVTTSRGAPPQSGRMLRANTPGVCLNFGPAPSVLIIDY